MSANEEYLDRLLQSLNGETPGKVEPISEVALETQTEPELESGPEAEEIPDFDIGAEPETEPGPEFSDFDIDQLAGIEPESGTELELMEMPDLNTEQEAGIEPELEMEEIPDFDMSQELETEPEPEFMEMPDFNTEQEAGIEAEPEMEEIPDFDMGQELESEPEAELMEMPDLNTEQENGIEAEPEMEEIPDFDMGQKPEPDVESEPDSAIEIEAEPEVSEPEQEVKMEPETELDLETESEFEFIPGIDMDDMESEPAMEDELAAVLGGGMEPEEESDLEPDKQMSVEEIAALLQSIPELDEDGEIQQQSQQSDVDDIDMLNLMDMMPEDEGISEINQLLEKNDSGEPVEEDMLSMFNGAGQSGMAQTDLSASNPEASGAGAPLPTSGDDEAKNANKKLSRAEKKALKAQEKERKALEKAAKKLERKSKKASGADSDAAEKPEKKKGFFGKLMDVLTEEAPEDDITIPPEQADGTADSENLAILQAIDNAPKEGKAKKGKKPKKEKKAKDKEEKEKKPKKVKKPKKEKKPKEKVEGPPEKKIPMRRIIPVILVCGTILAALMIVLNFYPKASYVSTAQKNFDEGNYEAAYRALSGWDLSGDDEDLYKKTALLVKMQRRADIYQNYVEENDTIHILDALIQAVKYHDNYAQEASERGVGAPFEQIYGGVLAVLSEYGLTEEQAKEFAAILDSVDYSIALEDFVYGPPEMPEIADIVDTPEPEDSEPEPEELAEEPEDSSEEPEDIQEEEPIEEPDSDTEEEEELTEEPQPDSEEAPEESPEDSGFQGGNVSQGGERLLYEFGVEKGTDGKYHGGQ